MQLELPISIFTIGEIKNTEIAAGIDLITGIMRNVALKAILNAALRLCYFPSQ